jgi:hypothetical protein
MLKKKCSGKDSPFSQQTRHEALQFLAAGLYILKKSYKKKTAK